MPADEISPLHTVNSVNPANAVSATDTPQQRQQQKQKREQPRKKKVRDYFRPLSKAVEASNKRLTDKNLPYRFNVFKRWGDVFIELFILNSDGSIRETQRKNISHDDFNRIIDDVTSIEGLFLDYRA